MLDRNIVLIGMPGCGKTTIGKNLSIILKKEFIDIDEYIEKMQNKSIDEFFLDGEESFRNIESAAVEEVSKKNNLIVSTGGGIVKKSENIEKFRENSIIIFINRPLELIEKDIDISTRPLLKNNKNALKNLYNERYPLYKSYCDYEAVNDRSVEYIVDELKNVLINHF
jgi:shikimate kinase